VTTVAHEAGAPTRRPWSEGFAVRDVSVSVAIAVMWIVVLLDALFGPDIVSSSPASFTRVPSAVIVAFFAYLATRIVAKWGYGPRDAERDELRSAKGNEPR
jgi:hypothetical protein